MPNWIDNTFDQTETANVQAARFLSCSVNVNN